jgi:hypothetical protein
MVDLQKTQQKFLEWVRSPEFDDYFAAIVGRPAKWRLYAGLILTVSIVGSPLGLILLWAWSRDRSSWKAARREAHLVFAGYQSILCSIVIANRAALEEGQMSPALLVGAFAPCTPELVEDVAKAGAMLGELYGEEPAQVAPELRGACQLVNDDEFEPSRRRPVPRVICSRSQLVLFDAVLDPSLLGGHPKDFPFVVCTAELKMGGGILQVPDEVVAWTQSKSGAPIHRHETVEEEKEIVFDSHYMEEVSDHLERHLGKVDSVFHEMISTTVHVDVHIIKPAPGRDWYTLVTSGMSDRKMAVPEGAEHLSRAELMLRLPPAWNLEGEAFKDEVNYWPVRWLKMLVRFPHELKTWLSAGHTIPNGDPASPLHPEVPFIGWALSKPFVGGEGFETLETKDGEEIHFFALVALYPSEMKYKLDRGWDQLLIRLNDEGVTDLIDMERPAVV